MARGAQNMKNGIVHLKIVSARDLPNVDAFSKSDPYVKFHWDNLEYKTTVVSRNLNPIWNQSFNLPCNIERGAYLLDLEILDHNKVKRDELIGRVSIDLRAIRSNFTECSWHPIKCNVKHNKIPEIKLEITVEDKMEGSKGSKYGYMAGHSAYPPSAYGTQPYPAYPPPGAGYPPPAVSYPPPATAAYPPPAAAAYPPPAAAAYPPPAAAAYPPPAAAAYPHPAAAAYPPPAAAAYPPPAAAAYPHPAAAAYPPPTRGTYPPPGASAYPHPTTGAYPPSVGSLPTASYEYYPPPVTSAYPPVTAANKGTAFSQPIHSYPVTSAVPGGSMHPGTSRVSPYYQAYGSNPEVDRIKSIIPEASHAEIIKALEKSDYNSKKAIKTLLKRMGKKK